MQTLTSILIVQVYMTITMTTARPFACYLITEIISFVFVTPDHYCIQINDLYAIQANKFKNSDWMFRIMLPTRVTYQNSVSHSRHAYSILGTL